MTNVITADKKNPSQIERTAQIKSNKPVKDKKKKYDYAEIIKYWTPQSNIAERILKNDPTKPFYLLITPEIALDILKMNDAYRNRPIDNIRIESYTTQMLKKNWMPKNGDTIRFSAEGMLLDGQHRLWSIHFSGVACEYLIVTGLSKDSMSRMDVGKNRNATDVTYVNNFGAHAGQLARIVKLIILFKNKSIVKGSISERDVANYDVNDFEQNKGVMSRLLKDLEQIVKITWIKTTKDYLTPDQWVFVFYVLRTLPGMDEEAYKFLNRFAGGNDLPANSPIRVLRTYFETDFKHLSKGNGKTNRSNKATLTTKVKYIFAAWNLHVTKTKVSEIKVDLTTPIISKPIYSKVA